jgi:hypothetical protein
MSRRATIACLARFHRRAAKSMPRTVSGDGAPIDAYAPGVEATLTTPFHA